MRLDARGQPLGPAHGHAIAHPIERRSDDLLLQVEHGSLYPALYRLEDRQWIRAFWGTLENIERLSTTWR